MKETLGANELGELKQSLRISSKGVNSQYLTLAKALFQSLYCIGPEGVEPWSYWGYTSWGEMVHTETGISLTKANALIRIWTKFGVELGRKWTTGMVLDITKMDLLCQVVSHRMSKETINDWIERARLMPVRQLRAVIRAKVEGREVDSIPQKTNVYITLSPLQKRMWDKTIEYAKEKYGVRDQGSAIAALLRELNINKKKGTRTKAA